MRAQFIFGVLLLFFTADVSIASESDPLPSVDTVIARMLAQDAQRQTLAAGYRGMRRYVLENERMHKHAEMLVRVECDATGTKHFELVDEEGWKAAYKHVLRKMLESEAEASQPQVRIKTRLSQENYDFHMVEVGLLDDRTAYMIDIVPKRREERLFEGRIWIDTRDYALVRAEGRPAKNPSFWTRSVHFTHAYRKNGPFWFPAATESVTDVRIFGSTNLTINYFDYTPTPLQSPLAASVEARGAITR
jgi:hypothetical protein